MIDNGFLLSYRLLIVDVSLSEIFCKVTIFCLKCKKIVLSLDAWMLDYVKLFCVKCFNGLFCIYMGFCSTFVFDEFNLLIFKILYIMHVDCVLII